MKERRAVLLRLRGGAGGHRSTAGGPTPPAEGRAVEGRGEGGAGEGRSRREWREPKSILQIIIINQQINKEECITLLRECS